MFVRVKQKKNKKVRGSHWKPEPSSSRDIPARTRSMYALGTGVNAAFRQTSTLTNHRRPQGTRPPIAD